MPMIRTLLTLLLLSLASGARAGGPVAPEGWDGSFAATLPGGQACCIPADLNGTRLMGGAFVLLKNDKREFGVFALTYTPPLRPHWQLLERHPIEQLERYRVSVEPAGGQSPFASVKVCASNKACVSYATASATEPLKPVPSSAYAGQEKREIKTFSKTEIEDILTGEGMGFAKPAELNGYPGPAHVLELSAQLRLSEKQLADTRRIHARMEADARAAGALLVAAERELDDLFSNRTVTPERLTTALEKAASAQARVREAHLTAHIAQTRLLSEAQIAQYKRLRGYGGEHGAHRHGQHHGHQ